MTKNDILNNLRLLNKELHSNNVSGEICLYGGAVMCIVFEARESTKDIDALFCPTVEMRHAINKIAEDKQIDKDWLNDGVKGYLVKHQKAILFEMSNLKVYHADPQYIFAMKAIAARFDSQDREDLEFLANKLNINSPQKAFKIIEKYYPKNVIQPKTQYFIEEVFSDAKYKRSKERNGFSR